MIRVLHLVEAALVTVMVVAVGWVGLWVYRLCADQLLWLPVVAIAVGFVVRLVWQWSPFGWVAGWHGAVSRRIEER